MQGTRDTDQREPSRHHDGQDTVGPLVVAARHPSLDDAVARFADELAAGVVDAHPTYVATAISSFVRTGADATLAAVAGGRIVGLGRAVAGGGAEVVVIATEDGRDARPALLRAIGERAAAASTEQPGSG